MKSFEINYFLLCYQFDIQVYLFQFALKFANTCMTQKLLQEGRHWHVSAGNYFIGFLFIPLLFSQMCT